MQILNVFGCPFWRLGLAGLVLIVCFIVQAEIHFEHVNYPRCYYLYIRMIDAFLYYYGVSPLSTFMIQIRGMRI